jgi:FtsZ-binding cell division protein ZapB
MLAYIPTEDSSMKCKTSSQTITLKGMQISESNEKNQSSATINFKIWNLTKHKEI